MRIKKVTLAIAIYAFATFGTVIESYALRVLDYTWNCVGCGGNCLDTVTVKEEQTV